MHLYNNSRLIASIRTLLVAKLTLLGYNSALVAHAFRGLAQLASARGLGPRGRRFESFIPDQN